MFSVGAVALQPGAVRARLDPVGQPGGAGAVDPEPAGAHPRRRAPPGTAPAVVARAERTTSAGQPWRPRRTAAAPLVYAVAATEVPDTKSQRVLAHDWRHRAEDADAGRDHVGLEDAGRGVAAGGPAASRAGRAPTPTRAQGDPAARVGGQPAPQRQRRRPGRDGRSARCGSRRRPARAAVLASTMPTPSACSTAADLSTRPMLAALAEHDRAARPATASRLPGTQTRGLGAGGVGGGDVGAEHDRAGPAPRRGRHRARAASGPPSSSTRPRRTAPVVLPTVVTQGSGCAAYERRAGVAGGGDHDDAGLGRRRAGPARRCRSGPGRRPRG